MLNEPELVNNWEVMGIKPEELLIPEQRTKLEMFKPHLSEENPESRYGFIRPVADVIDTICDERLKVHFTQVLLIPMLKDFNRSVRYGATDYISRITQKFEDDRNKEIFARELQSMLGEGSNIGTTAIEGLAKIIGTVKRENWPQEFWSKLKDDIVSRLNKMIKVRETPGPFKENREMRASRESMRQKYQDLLNLIS